MALTQTALAAACAATDEQITVSSVTGATVGGFVKIDSEFAIVKAIASPVIELMFRGKFGTRAAAHANLATVTFGLIADIVMPGNGDLVPIDPIRESVSAIGADGAIDVPTRNMVLHVKKGSAAALTLAAPSTFTDDITLEIVSDTAYAHTVTFTPGFYGNTTSSDVATWATTVGASAKFRASQGRWGVVALSGVTLG